MYPAFLDQLNLLESILMAGVILPSALAGALLWRNRLSADLTAPDRRAFILLLGLCILCFGVLVTSLTIRLP